MWWGLGGVASVPASTGYVRASTGRGNRFDVEERVRPANHWNEALYLDGGGLEYFEGCCHVDDGDTCILYATWDGTSTVKKGAETEVTHNPPYDLDAAALALLRQIDQKRSWFQDSNGGHCPDHTDVPKPSLN